MLDHTDTPPLFKAVDLAAKCVGQQILQGLSLTIQAGEVHAIMGPNGSGKSTLAKVVAGHPDYEVTGGQLTFERNFESVDLTSLSADERAREGVFLGFQYPTEIVGVSNLEFLRASFNAIVVHQGGAAMDSFDFSEFVEEKLTMLGFDNRLLEREVNVGLSGGEKKRNELLQLAVLAPRLAFLDETDSGLDVDSLRLVGEAITRLRSPDRAFVLITHYERLLNVVTPDFVHILAGGKIIESGGPELAARIEREGYEKLLANGQPNEVLPC